MAHQQQHPSPIFFLDALYCEEEHWEEGEEDEVEEAAEEDNENDTDNTLSVLPSFLRFSKDKDEEDDILSFLFLKQEQEIFLPSYPVTDPNLASARREAVEWILRVNAHYAFSALTAILSVNYLDRFLASLRFQRDEPWMMQLIAVACLSLSAKIEETQVPLLLDFQVEEASCVFEAKTIQRMELLVLSTLHWKMNPVTSIAFIDRIIERIGLKPRLRREFIRRCERLILSVVSDSRFVCYLPSEFAVATMLHVINELEPCRLLECKNQLLGVLKINKEKVEDCCQLILEATMTSGKRKYLLGPSSPKGVLSLSFSYDSSNDSWASSASSSPSPSPSPSPSEPLFKKSRVKDEQNALALA